MTVDAERLVSTWCRANEEIDDLIGDHIYTVLPAGFDDWPAVRLTLIDEADLLGARPLHLTDSFLQFDVWGGAKATAREIADTIRHELSVNLRGTHATGVVTGVKFGTFRYDPDETYEPARPRYIFEARVQAHPVPGSQPS